MEAVTEICAHCGSDGDCDDACRCPICEAVDIEEAHDAELVAGWRSWLDWLGAETEDETSPWYAGDTPAMFDLDPDDILMIVADAPDTDEGDLAQRTVDLIEAFAADGMWSEDRGDALERFRLLARRDGYLRPDDEPSISPEAHRIAQAFRARRKN